MMRSNKIYLLLIASFFAASFITSLGAQENCVHCGVKEPEGMSAANGVMKLAMLFEEKKTISFDSNLNVYCKRYIKIVRNMLPSMLKELEDTHYPIEDYFKKQSVIQKKSEVLNHQYCI